MTRRADEFPGGRARARRGPVGVLGVVTGLMISVATSSSAGEPSAVPQGPQCQAAASAPAYASFADQLLVRKQPRRAYEALAAEDMVQRNPPFGATRESTIRQWETMTTLTDARFAIEAVRVHDDVGAIRFVGRLTAGEPGARITQHDRFRCGRIVEEWAEFRPIKHDE